MSDRQASKSVPDDRAAGRAAGYCWARNPNGRGRCTKPPHHPAAEGHKDVYAHTTWRS